MLVLVGVGGIEVRVGVRGIEVGVRVGVGRIGVRVRVGVDVGGAAAPDWTMRTRPSSLELMKSVLPLGSMPTPLGALKVAP